MEVDFCPCEMGSFKKFQAGGCMVYASRGPCEPICQQLLMKGGDGRKAETVPGAQAWGGGYREWNLDVAGSRAAELA